MALLGFWEFNIIWLTKILCKILFAINFSFFIASSQISSRIFTENFLIKINFPSRKCNIFHRRFEFPSTFCVKIVRCFQRSRWDKVFLQRVFPSASKNFHRIFYFAQKLGRLQRKWWFFSYLSSFYQSLVFPIN